MSALKTEGQFNAIDPVSGWKVDLIVRKSRAFSLSEFARRTRGNMLGIEIALASMEDLVIAKLEWSELGDSDLQRWDLAQLLQANWGKLDLAYLQKWVGELGLQRPWQSLLHRVGRSATLE